MHKGASLDLLYGLEEGGLRHRRAHLRAFTGHDEALAHAEDTPVEAATALISTVVLSVGDITPITAQQALRLTVGDRERLLLAMSMMLSGDLVELVAQCPAPDCGAQADVQLRLSDFVRPGPAEHATPTVVLPLHGPAGVWSVTLKAPAGVDQQAAAHSSWDSGRALILGCVLRLHDPDGQLVTPNSLPAEMEQAVAEALMTLDPAAEAISRTACPTCGGPMDLLLDAWSLLRSCLSHSLDEEVYRMSRSFHWSEAEILGLPVHRRRRYLAVAASAEASA